MGNLASAYQLAGLWDASVRLWEELLEKRRAVSGPTDPATVMVMHRLAINYANMGRFAESLALHETALKQFPPTADTDRAWCMMSFAIVCQQAGKLDQAESLLREALVLARKRGDSRGRIGQANALGWLARTLLLRGEYAAAEPLLREAVAIFEKEAPHGQRRFYWVSQLGAVLLGQQKYAEAEQLLLQGYEGMKRREAMLPANDRRRLAEAGDRVVRFYEATKQPEKARVWREKLKAGKTGQAPAGINGSK